MKTTLMLAALSGLAFAQEPVPAVPGHPPDVTIPTFEARELAEPIRWAFGRSHDIVRSGPVGFLGVNAVILPHELSAHLSLPEDTGLMVEVVAKDSPAEKAGLQANDVLAKFDDQILIDPRQLSVLVANKKEGDTVKVAYVRKGQPNEATVVLGKRESVAIDPATGKMEADVLLERAGGAPLRTFVRRFNLPGGGEAKIESAFSEDVTVAPLPRVVPGQPGAPVPPPIDDVKKQLEEIRALLETLQQKVK